MGFSPSVDALTFTSHLETYSTELLAHEFALAKIAIPIPAAMLGEMLWFMTSGRNWAVTDNRTLSAVRRNSSPFTTSRRRVFTSHDAG